MLNLDLSEWVNFFFKLLNLSALFALFFYIFKRYMLEDLRTKVLKEKQTEEGMQTKILILEQKGKELVHATFTQEQYARYLLEKVDQWRQISELENEKKGKDVQLLQTATIARTAKQAKTIETERLMEIVIPKAINQARVALIANYEDEKQGAAYLKNLLVQMKKSI